MPAESLASLTNFGMGGAVIVSIVIFLNFIDKRDKMWREFFDAQSKLNKELMDIVSKLTEELSKLTSEVNDLRRDLDCHNNNVKILVDDAVEHAIAGVNGTPKPKKSRQPRSSE